MKNIKHTLSIMVLMIFFGCSTENDLIDIDALGAPAAISALTTITQDNSGNVTFLPRGEGVTRYEVFFGDATTTPAYVSPGDKTTHKYAEGVYKTTIVGTSINGKRTEVNQEVTVSFLAPTDLVPTISPVSGDNFSINVSATAKLETYFQVYFGEVANEIPVDFMEGETITHKYATVGTYTVKIVALSGGIATTTKTESVVISNPIYLPVTFETTVPAFGNFGGAYSGGADNPSIDTENGSAKVAKLTKTAGAEVWAGSTIELAEPIDFSTKKVIKMKVRSPKAGIVVKMKLEKLVATDATNIEVDATTTIANGWEELTFDFSAANNANNYQRVVVFFDFGDYGTGADYYYDDIKLVTGDEALELPLTFESTKLIYKWNGFGASDFGAIPASVVFNPDQSGNNVSAKVVKIEKTAGAQVWAGAGLDLDSSINFAKGTKIKVNVWSPKAGAIILFKMEVSTSPKDGNGNPTVFVEVQGTTTVANSWQVMTFDLTSTSAFNTANAYDRVILFPDFNVGGTGTAYYFDDIKQSN